MNKESNIINAFNKYKTIIGICKETGYSDKYVRYILNKNNLIDMKTSEYIFNEKYIIAKEKYINGESIKNICKELKMGTRNLSNRLQLDGIKIRGKSITTVIVNQEQQNEIIELYKSNNSIRQIADKLKINRSNISKILKENGFIITKKKYRCNEKTFEKIDNEEKAYWLGFLYADGCVSKLDSSVELLIQDRDKEHLKKFKDFCESNYPLVYTEYIRKTGYIVKANKISIYSKKMHEDLINKGCFPLKSLILKFPTTKQVPKYLIKHFIRGYMDGDGCVGIDNKNIFVSFVGTKEFLEQLQIIFKTNNKLFETGKAFVYKVKGNKKALKILDFLYKDATIYLERKFEIYRKHKVIC